jgi:cytochrome c
MKDRFNTIAGWVLFAGIVALGGTIVTGEIFRDERPEKMGYPIEGVVLEGDAGAAEAEKPIAFYLASADPAKGEQVFKKCAACHNAEKGGANQLGPNLWGVIGDEIAHGRGGFPFSDALKSVGGSWDFENMSAWLHSPKKFAPGTKMTFAGLSDPQDRANVIAFLNQHSDAPKPMPAAPAETAPAESADDAAANKPGVGTNNGPQKAEDEPVLGEAQAATANKSINGEAAPKPKE